MSSFANIVYKQYCSQFINYIYHKNDYSTMMPTTNLSSL